jgi:hypothetical protein
MIRIGDNLYQGQVGVKTTEIPLRAGQLAQPASGTQIKTGFYKHGHNPCIGVTDHQIFCF